MKIKGVLFDFNGTLFWDTELHNQAWDQFLEKHSINLNDSEKDKKIHGKNNKEILTNLFSTNLTQSAIEKLSIEKEEYYQALCLKQTLQLAPGSISFLEFLLKNEIPYTIATASDKYNVD